MTTTYYLLLTTYCLLFAFLTWRNFNFALAFLFFCLPTYLIRFHIGTLPTTLLELMIWIITIIWLIKYHKSIILNLKSLILNHRSLFISLSLFILAATISISTSINTRAALGELKAFYVEPIILFLILITTFQYSYKLQVTSYNKNQTIDAIIFALTLCGLATSILAILQHFTGWLVPDAFWANQNTYRVTAWYGFPNAVGLFLAPIVPLTIFLIIQTWQKITGYKLQVTSYKKLKLTTYNLQLITLIVTIPASILAIIYARSTGALVALAAGLIFFLFFYNKKARWIAIIISILGISSILGLSGLSGLRQELFFADRSGQLRVNMWAETTEFLKAHPIAGAGLASYSKLIYPYRIDKWIEVFHHPHNIFLTMWVNLGLLGLFAFVWIIVAIFNFQFSIFKQFKKFSIFNLCVLTSLVIILVMGLVDSPYIKNDLAILFWLLPALLISQEKTTA